MHLLNSSQRALHAPCTHGDVYMTLIITGNWIGLDWIGSDRIGSDRIRSDRIGSVRIGSDQIGSDRIRLDRIFLLRIVAHCMALHSIGSDRIGSNWIESMKHVGPGSTCTRRRADSSPEEAGGRWLMLSRRRLKVLLKVKLSSVASWLRSTVQRP